MKAAHSTLAIALFLGAVSAPLHADDTKHDMPGMQDQSMSDMKDHNMSGMGESGKGVETYRGQGTVNGVDEKSGKINLSHSPIESLNWPAMTMDFSVKDPAILRNFQSGVKVDFELEKSDGGYRIVRIMPVQE